MGYLVLTLIERSAMRVRPNAKHPRASALCLMVSVLAVLAPDTGYCTEHEDPYAEARRQLARTIEEDVRQTSDYLGKSELDPRTIEAMATVPRHEFVPEALRAFAYANEPLPIGNDQTISQPYIVAIMTDLLDLPPDCKVLDIGTGSGYQAAVLAEICASVFSIEIVEPLGTQAAKRLARLGYDNVSLRIGDGFFGWPEEQPFDAIVVAAATDELPEPLIEQLKPGGRMIIPLYSGFASEQLVLVEKHADQSITTREILPVRFVPLTGDHD